MLPSIIDVGTAVGAACGSGVARVTVLLQLCSWACVGDDESQALPANLMQLLSLLPWTLSLDLLWHPVY